MNCNRLQLLRTITDILPRFSNGARLSTPARDNQINFAIWGLSLRHEALPRRRREVRLKQRQHCRRDSSARVCHVAIARRDTSQPGVGLRSRRVFDAAFGFNLPARQSKHSGHSSQSDQVFFAKGVVAWPPLLCDCLYAEIVAFGWLLSAFGFLASLLPFSCPFATIPSRCRAATCGESSILAACCADDPPLVAREHSLTTGIQEALSKAASHCDSIFTQSNSISPSPLVVFCRGLNEARP